MSNYATPQEEAADILAQVLRELPKPECDLKAALMRSQFASYLMGWYDWRDWCQREVNGYAQEDVLSAFRRITGELTWRRKRAGAYKAAEDEMYRALAGADTVLEAQSEPILWEFRYGFDLLKQLADSELHFHDEPTGRDAVDFSRRSRSEVQLEQVRRFTPAAFRSIIERLRQTLLDFAIHRYAYVRYGAVIRAWHLYSQTGSPQCSWASALSNLQYLKATPRSLPPNSGGPLTEREHGTWLSIRRAWASIVPT